MKNLIFLCVSTAIIIFTVIVLNNAPIINGLVGSDWYDESCQKYVDLHKYNKDKAASDLSSHGVSTTNEKRSKDKWLKLLKKGKNKCYRNKAMIGLEYTSFNFNIVFGFTCALLGLFNYLKIGNIGKIIGIIGLGSGAIGFVLTFVYIIYSGYIFTQDALDKSFTNIASEFSLASPKIRNDGAFAKWDEDKKGYVCLYYKKNNEDAFYMTYSDYGSKNLNYRTKIKYPKETKNYKYFGCYQTSRYSYSQCKTRDETSNLGGAKNPYFEDDSSTNEKGKCDYLYYYDTTVNDYKKQNIYDRWVITIVFGCFIFVLDIGLAVFGFLIFKDGGSSGTPL